MSKIFDALNKKPGQIPDLELSKLWNQRESGRNSTQIAAEPAVNQPKTPERKPELEICTAPPQEIVEPAVDATASAEAAPVIRTLPLQIPVNSPLFPFDGEHWEAAEQYRMARTKIVQHPRQPHVLVISSASPSDGKTLTAINMAGALALKGEGNVVLVDADLRLSAVEERLGFPTGPGLTDVLTGSATLDEALIRAEQFPKLYILRAGTVPRNPTELLGSFRWRSLCDALRASFRYVVMDSPPIGAVADYELIQAVCDGVLLVIRPDHTGRKICMRAIQTIPGDKFIGVLLNCVPEWFGRKSHYSSYYGAYGGVSK